MSELCSVGDSAGLANLGVGGEKMDHVGDREGLTYIPLCNKRVGNEANNEASPSYHRGTPLQWGLGYS